MDGMPPAAHAKQKDHLWVLVVIAACCLIKVWPSWVGIGAEAGFPKIVKMPTDWTLAVVVEAYWAYAVYAWLAAAQGRRSRRFAMWSAAGVFVLSLTAQSTAGLMNAKAADAFANAMPVTVLALIAVLVHLRHTDRAALAEAERAQREAAAQAQADAAAGDERTALRAELAAVRAELETAASDREALRADLAGQLETAQADLAEALTRAEKLAAKTAHGKPRKNAQGGGRSDQADDITTEFRALDEMQKDPSLRGPRMGGELARRLNVSAATGRRLHAKLTAQEHSGESLTEPLSERSAGPSDERS